MLGAALGYSWHTRATVMAGHTLLHQSTFQLNLSRFVTETTQLIHLSARLNRFVTETTPGSSHKM